MASANWASECTHLTPVFSRSIDSSKHNTSRALYLSFKPTAAELSSRFSRTSKRDFASMTTVPEIFLMLSSAFLKSTAMPHNSLQASLTNMSSWSASESACASADKDDRDFRASLPERHEIKERGEGSPRKMQGFAAATRNPPVEPKSMRLANAASDHATKHTSFGSKTSNWLILVDKCLVWKHSLTNLLAAFKVPTVAFDISLCNWPSLEAKWGAVWCERHCKAPSTPRSWVSSSSVTRSWSARFS